MHIQELAELVGYSVATVKIFLDRAEFADIRPKRNSQICHGVTNEHIQRLISLRGEKYKKCKCKCEVQK